MEKIKLGKMAILGLVLILILGVVVLRSYENGFPGNESREVYLSYQSSNPAVNFIFEYPEKGWILKESRGTGQPYDAVQLLGPRDEQNQYSANISVTVKTLDPETAAMDPLGAFLKGLERFHGFKVTKKEKIKIQNSDHPAASYEYSARLPLWKKNAKNVLMKGTTVFVFREKKSYRITYSCTAEQNKASETAFAHFLETFHLSS